MRLRPGWNGRMLRVRSPVATVAVASLVIATAIALAVTVHLLLGMLTIRIAVARASVEDRKAALALTQFFAAQHPRVRIRTVLQQDRLEVGKALDRGEAEIAILRSDAPTQDGQSLVVLGHEAIVFVAPGGSHVDSVAKLRGATVALLDGRRLDARLLDLILAHAGIPTESVRREVLTVDGLPHAAREKRIDAVFVVAPAASKLWLPVYAALRKGAGAPRMFEVDEAAAIAQENPFLDTLDVPKGTFVGAPPAPGDDVTTLSVSHRLVAGSTMPDWLAGEITREVLTGKPRLVVLDGDLAGIEAPDTDAKDQALPIHPGTAAYLSGNLPSLSDQGQNLAYWFGLIASGVASLSAAGAALYRRLRPVAPSARLLRLLEIWRAVRAADAVELHALEVEADALAAEAIRDEAYAGSDGAELRLVTPLVQHVRAAAERRRTEIFELSTRRSPGPPPSAEPSAVA